MALSAGTRLGPYEILAPLGAGGMGEVYRARDTRLNRDVAIKVLPASLTRDAERLQRFEQEARATSALNHPNILTIYDIGAASPDTGGAPFMVAELLEGEELRAKMQDGEIVPRKAVDYALQIVSGLAAAHDKGIVHRDLKPENVFVTNDDRVKILDFGLAKLRPQGTGPVGADAATQHQITDPGVVMGTVGYMSPEQVRGQDADHRSDFFSFGVMLYELLSGRRAFHRETPAETLTAILKDDPGDLIETNTKIPPALDRIVRRCLEKKPEMRFQSAHDLGFALSTLSTASGPQLDEAGALAAATGRASASPLVSRERRVWIAVGALLGLAAMGVAWFAVSRQPAVDARVFRMTIVAPENTSVGSLAVSPDGRWLAFAAATGGRDQLWLRALDALTAQPITGTEGASFPFWSPDSRYIGFFAGGKLKRVAIPGGPMQTLCDAGISGGGSWNRDGVIVFTALGFGLYRVSATGGDVTPLTTLDRSRLEWNYHSPSFLPDGRHFLYYIQSGRKEARGVYVGSLDRALKQRLLGTEWSAIYAASGHDAGGYLLFVREGALLAQPFDAERLLLTGEQIRIADRVGRDANFPRGHFSSSTNGVLIYDPSVNRQSKQLRWVNREGKPMGLPAAVGAWANPWLSPDERRVAVDRIGNEIDTREIWLQDLAGGVASRFTFDAADDVQPVWSPDGNRIVWASNREGTYDLYQKAANGAGQDELLFKSDNLKVPTDWSLDGRFILYYQPEPKTKRDVWVLPLTGDRKPFPLLQTEANETGGQFSPDVRWMAYASDESGAYEIYIQSFPSGGGKRQVSTAGGIGPHWRRDGKELFYYATDGKLMAVEVRAGASVDVSLPRALFEFRSGNGLTTVAPYTVTADGQRFLLNTIVDESGGEPLAAVVNWIAALKK